MSSGQNSTEMNSANLNEFRSLPLADLRIENLTKKMGAFTLSADFTVKKGERVALLGRSGGGKTTLLRLIAGLEPFGPGDSGKISLGTQDITEWTPQKREIGIVFQEQALFPALTVLENAAFGLRMKGMAQEERRQKALDWLERVDMKSLADARIGRLSGGEKQRVAFIRALIWRPRLLLLDEPFSALDPEMRAVLRRELIELHRLWPAPLLIVTHDERDVEALEFGQGSRLALEWSPESHVRKIHPAAQSSLTRTRDRE